MTGETLIKRAMRTIGALAANEPLDAGAAVDALAILSGMLDTWRTQRLNCYVIASVDTAMVSGQSEYTLGPGGDINVARPVFIDRASVVQNPGAANELETPLHVIRSAKEWQGVSNKLMTSTWPQRIYLQVDFPLTKLFPWPVMTANTLSLRLYLPKAITGLANLATDYTFAPGYEEALVYNLALRLAPEFEVAVPDIVRELAAARLSDVKRTNISYTTLTLDPALTGRRRYYDIYTGDYL